MSADEVQVQDSSPLRRHTLVEAVEMDSGLTSLKPPRVVSGKGRSFAVTSRHWIHRTGTNLILGKKNKQSRQQAAREVSQIVLCLFEKHILGVSGESDVGSCGDIGKCLTACLAVLVTLTHRPSLCCRR